MDVHNTPKASSRDSANTGSPFVVPPTPCLKKIGWGTGVVVYHMDRSPFSGVARSPWALKKVSRAPKRKKFIGSRLKLEADILKKLNHPNIVGFRCFTKTKDGREVLAMEECEESLGTILENRYENKEGPMEAELIIKIIYEVCKALRYVHTEHRIIHGDIKSYNILIKGDYDAIKLCDFGVSFPLNEAGEAQDYVGTEVWSAPEVLIGGSVTVKADIFALGLTIWEMVCLVPPHTGSSVESCDSFDESLDSVDNYGTRPSFPEGLGDRYKLVERLFTWCTEQDLNNRPTADEIIALIDATHGK
uniref:Lymphokine-activated killer T-cell-originated protein kinase n=1 Tax=Lygus hesperus TaxID=30085 RepID=A0A146L2V1_LYGHE